MDSPSIFNLFTQLCQILCKDFNNERVNGPALGHKAVQRFRKQAFEILLFERHEEDEREPLREFQFHQFDMRQNAKTTLDRDRCDQLENCIGNLLNEMEFFRSDSGQSLLMLLLLLKNSINYNVENSVTVDSSFSANELLLIRLNFRTSTRLASSPLFGVAQKRIRTYGSHPRYYVAFQRSWT